MTDNKQHDATTEFNEALAAGFAAGDFEGVGAFYTEDTRLMPPRGKVFEGRASVGGFWLGVSNRFSSMTFTTTDLRTLGDTVRRETGTYAMGSAEGQASEGRPGVQGKYVFVWLLVDGEWQIESSIWNRSDAGAGRQQGHGQGGGQGQRAGQGLGGAPGGQGGGYRRGAGGGQGAGHQGGGYRQAGGQGGGYRQGGGRPSFQGGGGAGGQRRGGGQGQAGGGYGGGAAAGGQYDGDAGLYSNPKG